MGPVNDVIRLLCYLFPNEKIKAQLESSLRAGGTVGSFATVGAIVGGPVGLLVGGVVGSVLGYWWCKDDFKSLPQVLWELSDEEKKKLFEHLRHVLGNLQSRDSAHLLTQVSAQPILKQQILKALRGFFKCKMNTEANGQKM